MFLFSTCKRLYTQAPINEYLVDENELKKFVSLKNSYNRKRTFRAVIQTISIILKMLLFYLDILTDIFLAVDYWNKDDLISFSITLFFVIFSWLLRVAFLVSAHRKKIKDKWKDKKIDLILRLLCPKMIYWYVN
jgi:uncharacterized membrane protein